MKQRGHIVHPHGTNHTNKAEVPLAEAQKLILHCLDTFDKKLPGFDPRQAIFAMPYLATTPELDAWFPSVVRAFRPAGPPINPLPGPDTVRINTGGAEDCEPWLLAEYRSIADDGRRLAGVCASTRWTAKAGAQCAAPSSRNSWRA